MRKKINIQKGAVLGAILTTIVAGMLLSVVQVVVKPPLLLGERLLPGGGWIQIVLAALFGGWLYLQMFDRKRRGMWRRRIWLLFSIVFFSQLFLGILPGRGIIHAVFVSRNDSIVRRCVVQPALLFRGVG